MNELDHNTEISLVANAVFFDLDILVVEVFKRFTNFEDLPIEEIVNELIIDKSISEDEARDMLNDFTKKYYGRGIYDFETF